MLTSILMNRELHLRTRRRLPIQPLVQAKVNFDGRSLTAQRVMHLMTLIVTMTVTMTETSARSYNGVKCAFVF